MVNGWNEPNDQVQQELSEQECSPQAAGSRQPMLKRLISGTGSVLGFAKLKLASWYEAEEQQSNVPHIDL